MASPPSGEQIQGSILGLHHISSTRQHGCPVLFSFTRLSPTCLNRKPYCASLLVLETKKGVYSRSTQRRRAVALRLLQRAVPPPRHFSAPRDTFWPGTATSLKEFAYVPSPCMGFKLALTKAAPAPIIFLDLRIFRTWSKNTSHQVRSTTKLLRVFFKFQKRSFVILKINQNNNTSVS